MTLGAIYLPQVLEHIHTCEVERAFDGCVLIAIGTVYRIFTYAGSVFSADGTRSGIGRIGGANEVAEIFHCIVFFQNSRHDGAAAHEFAKFAVKRTFTVNGVKFAGFLHTEFRQFHGNNAETRRIDHLKNVANVAGANCVGLDHSKCAIACHDIEVINDEQMKIPQTARTYAAGDWGRKGISRLYFKTGIKKGF